MELKSIETDICQRQLILHTRTKRGDHRNENTKARSLIVILKIVLKNAFVLS